MSSALPADQIAAVAKAAGFAGRDLTLAVAVAYAESGGIADNVNHNSDQFRSTDFGLWQINDHYWGDLLKTGSWSNPADNARMAYTVYKAQGWDAWYAYQHGSHLAFMAKAAAGVAKVNADPASVSVPAATIPEPVVSDNGSGFGNSLLRLGSGILGLGLLVIALSALSGKVDPKEMANVALLAATKGRA